MPPPLPKRSRYSSRPLVTALLLITIITTYYALFSPKADIASRQLHRRSPQLVARHVNDDVAELEDVDCRMVHSAEDQCAFILANCEDDEAGLVHYLSFYYCTLGGAKPVAFAILASWLGLLFTTIGIAASDFFSVNLSTIASVLGLSESLAGVTFLAFGNGSPDVFSTFAAMGSNSGSMAVGELIGAAGFITAVVAGSMALVREFKVSKRTFIRDIAFFIVAVSFTMVCLADGELHLWECLCMIGFYLFYVAVVVGWHWFTTRRRRQRLRDVASRTHYFGPSGRGTEEFEPYRDEPEDDAAPVGGRSSSAPEAADISVLERAPRIEVDGVEVPAAPFSEDQEDRDLHVAAEMANSMRANRPRWTRSNTTTIAPIRPSLVGVLEFRSVLSSLQKARNMHMGPLPVRANSGHQRASSTAELPRGRPRNSTLPAHLPTNSRERALSNGNDPLNLPNPALPHPDLAQERPSTRMSSASRTIDGMLAPPLGSSTAAIDHVIQEELLPMQSPRLQLQIPPSHSRTSSGHSSPSLSPFPGFSESPALLTPASLEHPPSFPFPDALDMRRQSISGFSDHVGEPKPVRWWPYSVLPPPHVLLATIFPTLQGWKEKTWWDKILSLISVPSIFILVTTLPVVETDAGDGDSSEVDFVDSPEFGQLGNTATPVSVQESSSVQPEEAWQEYRRRTKSVSSRSMISPSPSQLSLQQPPDSGSTLVSDTDHQQDPQFPTNPPVIQQANKPVSLEADLMTTASEPPSGWNRWLVALQLFTGPMFVVLIGWANTMEDYENPAKTLLMLVLYSLVVSLCLLGALLLTTSPDSKPKYHFLLCFLGFVISVAWISTIAGEVVGVMKAFGVILDISEAILGLTVFAVGNSLGDLVADVTVARLGYPVMALAACFGGPMLNILLGIGIGGAWMSISAANKKHKKHPHRPIEYKAYRIQVGGTLMISAVTVLLTLITLLILVPSNNWMMTRKTGWILIAIWSVSTVVNLVVELTGVWADVS
ncbi:Sodium/calcium exchanger protein-domain-containing protein [Triangularia verruculosa]|uniref:Sodium/calcium exchanger protein-domain-containing protein n=1 Tax=Triangularia verruculosa TaxID=2587418 RepID=A0AAN6X9W9_9PEZI|nr:Sodium/calcium exchanger protein-domain-containing protein [Triangularia verruculosa]